MRERYRLTEDRYRLGRGPVRKHLVAVLALAWLSHCHSRLLRWWYLLVFVLPPHPHRNVQSGRTKGLTMILTYALVISVGHWEANGACFICQLQGVTCIQQVRISAAP